MLQSRIFTYGDFNQHHPLWDEAKNAHLFTHENLEMAQPLLNLLGWYNMKMALPPYIPTLKAMSTGNHTRVDNIFCNETLMDVVIKCTTDDVACPVKMDHYPIIMQINIHAPKPKSTPRLNFRMTDWLELVKTLLNNLTNLPIPTEITSIQEFDTKLKPLNVVINDVINKHIKVSVMRGLLF